MLVSSGRGRVREGLPGGTDTRVRGTDLRVETGMTVDASAGSPQQNYSASLQRLVSTFFPQYGLVRYEAFVSEGGVRAGAQDGQRSPSADAMTGCEDASQQPLEGTAGEAAHLEEGEVSFRRYRCRVHLLDLPIETLEEHASVEAAKEGVSKIAFETLSTFMECFWRRKDDPMFGELFTSLVADAAPSAPSKAGEQGSNDAGHCMTLPSDTLGEGGDTVVGPLGACFLGELTRNYHPEGQSVREQPGRGGAQQARGAPPGKAKAAPAKSLEVLREEARRAPLPFLNEYVQKSETPDIKPAFDIYRKELLFGGIASYACYRVEVPFTFARKADARAEAALCLCMKLFGGSTLSAAAEDGPKAEAPPAAHQPSDGTPLTTARVPPPMLPAKAPEESSGGPSMDEANWAEVRSAIPQDALTVSPPPGLRFVSMIDHYCQRARIEPPTYAVFGPGTVVPALFCCQVTSFCDGKTFVGLPQARKTDTKEDCAGRIYEYLVERSFMTPGGAPINKR